MKNALVKLLLLLSVATYAQSNKKLSRVEKDFEMFWTIFKDNYALFKLKGVNWDSTYVKYRPLVTATTNEKEFLSILGQMVDPLKDGHITISKGEDVVYKSGKSSAFRQEFKGLEKEFWQMVDTTLTTAGFYKPVGVGPLFKGENLYYFSQIPQTGYIRITRCFANPESLFDDKEELNDTKLMLRLFDSLLQKMQSVNALIVDLRTNGGGHGGIELASRFVTKKRLTHYKSVKQKGSYESFSPLQAQYILPTNKSKYKGKLLILTSDRTASSAEDFTISLYQQKGVVTIGTNTSGMLSDMFSGQLSNNISFTLSNQVYYSTDKQILEDKGVPVTHAVVNTKKDIENKKDPVLVKALELQ